jgi:flavin reductase (DIM6/NTAB) family NADH-FMN oxidoreductase RutF
MLNDFKTMRISQQIFPRPVALIATVDNKGRENVMSASFLMPLSFNPKYVAVAITPERHTFSNIKEIGEFTVNIATLDMLEQVRICGKYSGRDVDKFSMTGLTKVPSKKVRPPGIAESPITLECVVEYMGLFGDHYLIVGRVVEEHVRRTEFSPLLHYAGDSYMEARALKS